VDGVAHCAATSLNLEEHPEFVVYGIDLVRDAVGAAFANSTGRRTLSTRRLPASTV
jgi:hypothetical protein